MLLLKGKYFYLLLFSLIFSLLITATYTVRAEEESEAHFSFEEVSVHDPMINKVDETYYVFGSHLASAKSEDLIDWTQISRDWEEDNPLIPDPEEELKKALEWPEPEAESTWAKSVIELNGKYHMYFSVSTWGETRSGIGMATADNIEGPYEYQDLILRSGMQGESEEKGVSYDETIHPNAIDPYVFFDKNDKLWMIYGSYFGGIFILEMNPETGKPYPDQGYGKRITGGENAAMEGSYILYHPETDYYYLFLSFGTLDTDGGYNIRVARSENPDGPYYDPEGKDMREAQGSHPDIEPYGARLIGNFELEESNLGYLSPGHNSAYYEEESEEMYIFFHSRFPEMGERHNLRVHQMVMNSEDWPVIVPHRYKGESVKKISREEIPGTYQYINHGQDISAEVNHSENIEFKDDGSINGSVTGEWELVDDYRVELRVEGETYDGLFVKQWDDGLKEEVMTFSALSEDGIAVWGSKTKTE